MMVYRADGPDRCRGTVEAQEAKLRATAVQRQAADPTMSVILRASAGSGKTKVLVDRFVRLCLAGSRPKAILAVTFTRKAAVEIKERLLERARDYAQLPPGDLETLLRKLLDRQPEQSELLRAAQLYEEILEDFSGLQVGTIHSFCQQILGRFAAEVGLDPRFQLLEREDELWEEALDALEREVVADAAARAELARLASTPTEVRRRLTTLRYDRVHLERWLDRIHREAGEENSTAGALLDYRRAPLLPRLTADLRAVLFAGTVLADRTVPRLADLAGPAADAAEFFAADGLDSVAAGETELTGGFRKQTATLREGMRLTAADLRAAGAGAAGVGEAGDEEAVVLLLEQLRRLLLTEDAKLRNYNGKKETKAVRQVTFAAAASPLLTILGLAAQLELYRWNVRLLRFGLGALDLYDALKRRDRCIDFQDLERLAWALMRSDLGPYVQYRFDEAIDHLLVDEFQDTNRNQWEILRPFAEEFLAGESVRGIRRTIFLVGDVKQSIYGFRGADPAIFGEVGHWLSRQAETPTLNLPTNFRSLPAVVASVGSLFSREPLASAWPRGVAETTVQDVARDEAPGHVVILPAIHAADEELGADHLAAATAVDIVRRLTTPADEGEGTRQPYRYGDVLVLCRNRTHIATYEQAFRSARIPIVPAGRGLLAKSREVRDVLALLRWLSYPNDDTALASLLRAPIFRVEEATLQHTLALRNQDASLWSVLLGASEELGLGEVVALLKDWRDRVGFQSCHDLLRHVYRTGHVLQRYHVALGEQARYNLLRLCDLALSPELGRFPTLRGLAHLIARAADTAAEEEAALPEAGSGRVRLMTVHSAKGLEAPVVLLVDADALVRDDVGRLTLASTQQDGPFLYGVKRQHWESPRLPENAPPLDSGVLGSAATHARREALREETDILYVAMTRARDELYVLGGETVRKGKRQSYLDWLQRAVGADRKGTDTAPYSLELPPGLQDPDAGSQTVGAGWEGDGRQHTPAIPDPIQVWSPPPQRPSLTLVTPSAKDEVAPRDSAIQGDLTVEGELLVEAGLSTEAGFTADVGSEVDDETRTAALRRGESIHFWLQRAAEVGEMPEIRSAADSRSAKSEKGVEDLEGTKDAKDADDIEAYEEARAVFDNPAFTWIFHPANGGGRGLVEVPFIHRLTPPAPGAAGTEQRVIGVIDRLVLEPGRAVVIDYKSDAVTGEGAEMRRRVAAYRPQLVSYRQAVQALYPEREVSTFLLFTRPRSEAGGGLLIEVETGREG